MGVEPWYSGNGRGREFESQDQILDGHFSLN